MTEHLLENLQEAYPVLQNFLGPIQPTCGLILGSGLGPYAYSLQDAQTLPFEAIPHIKTTTATGHKGQFVLGKTPAGSQVLCMQGRVHGYEGYTAAEVAFPVWLMHECGINTLITTNAAGAINPSYSVGEFCIMSDYINLTGRNPLVGIQPNHIADRFVPMNDAFDLALRALAKQVAQKQAIAYQEGVYVGLLGPSFETPAEIQAFARLGADSVAMSVVEEVIAARHVGMRVLGISLLSNMAAGLAECAPSDSEVHDVAKLHLGDFAGLMNGIIDAL